MMKNGGKIKKIIGIVTSVVSMIMGLCFIIQILRIYFSSSEGQIFTREKTGQYLLQILAVILVWIIAVIVGGILSYVFESKKDEIAKFSNKEKYDLIMKSLPFNRNNSLPEYQIIKKEDKKRRIGFWISFGIVLISLGMSCLYLFNPKHFIYDGNPTGQIKKMAFYLLPWISISFITCILYAVFEEISTKKAYQACKNIISQKGKYAETPYFSNKGKYVLNIVRGMILILAVTLIIAGAINGGGQRVMQKAINICTECIGLG